MDESGNGHPEHPLIVGALVVDTYIDLIEKEIRSLHRQLAARRDLRGTRHFSKFCKVGFHASDDPYEIAEPFLGLVSDLPGFRVFMAMTDRTSLVDLSEVEQIKTLYSMVISDNLLRYTGREELVCHLEENDSLRSSLREIQVQAVRKAQEKSGPSAVFPDLRIKVVEKSKIMSMAILDYTMLAVKRWAQDDFTNDIKRHTYRQFAGVQDHISVLYSLEKGVVLNRKSPLHGQGVQW